VLLQKAQKHLFSEKIDEAWIFSAARPSGEKRLKTAPDAHAWHVLKMGR
jgi:hypothetical protein